MFGLPDHNILSETVATLTRPHPHKTGGHEGTEPPLLLQLEQAIASDSGRGSAPGGSTRAGVPLDVNALHIRDSIAAVVSEHWPGHGDLSRAATPLMERLEQWTSELAGGELETYLLEFCVYWVQQIRDLLDPPVRIPLRGVACAECGTDTITDRDPDDGGKVFRPAVVVHASEDPLRAECLECGAGWRGDALKGLA